MIYPNKTIELKYTLLGVGSLIIAELHTPQTASSLWENVRTREEIGSFEKYVLTLDFLYLIGLVKMDDGIIRRGDT
ncbi:MAG: ABC-three component system middle component 6 [Methanosarcinaceae archaeon]